MGAAMMSLHPQQRAAMQDLRDHMPEFRVVERHFRRTERLMVVGAVLALGVLSLVASFETGVWEGLAQGALFALGVSTGIALVNANARRRAWAQLCELDEIAALSLALDDVDDEDE